MPVTPEDKPAPARQRRTSAQTREHVLATARELFYWHGICATGVDRVAAEADVAATTLYRIFGSKDELIAAYIERENVGFQAWFEAAVAAGGADPRARIRALYEALEAQVQPERCRGCPFLMLLAEVPDQQAAAHQIAVANKQWVRDQLGRLTAALDVADPANVADELALVLDGVYASRGLARGHGSDEAGAGAGGAGPGPGRPSLTRPVSPRRPGRRGPARWPAARPGSRTPG